MTSPTTPLSPLSRISASAAHGQRLFLTGTDFHAMFTQMRVSTSQVSAQRSLDRVNSDAQFARLDGQVAQLMSQVGTLSRIVNYHEDLSPWSTNQGYDELHFAMTEALEKIHARYTPDSLASLIRDPSRAPLDAQAAPHNPDAIQFLLDRSHSSNSIKIRNDIVHNGWPLKSAILIQQHRARGLVAHLDLVNAVEAVMKMACERSDLQSIIDAERQKYAPLKGPRASR